MNKALSYSLSFVLLGTLAQGQAGPDLKKGDRPVFYSAGALAKDCQEGLAITNGEPLQADKHYTVSLEQVAGEAKCEAYIDGVYDERLESGSRLRYNPVKSRLTFEEKLIDTFIKYVADHPEEEDFAASPVRLTWANGSNRVLRLNESG